MRPCAAPAGVRDAASKGPPVAPPENAPSNERRTAGHSPSAVAKRCKTLQLQVPGSVQRAALLQHAHCGNAPWLHNTFLSGGLKITRFLVTPRDYINIVSLSTIHCTRCHSPQLRLTFQRRKSTSFRDYPVDAIGFGADFGECGCLDTLGKRSNSTADASHLPLEGRTGL